MEVEGHGKRLYCHAGSISSFSVYEFHRRIEIIAERLIGEVIKMTPCPRELASRGVPHRFVWRGRTMIVIALLRTWLETGKYRQGSHEMYVRKHWYEVATGSNGTIKIYFERQPRGGRKGTRWWLFSISEPEERPAANT